MRQHESKTASRQKKYKLYTFREIRWSEKAFKKTKPKRESFPHRGAPEVSVLFSLTTEHLTLVEITTRLFILSRLAISFSWCLAHHISSHAAKKRYAFLRRDKKRRKGKRSQITKKRNINLEIEKTPWWDVNFPSVQAYHYDASWMWAHHVS